MTDPQPFLASQGMSQLNSYVIVPVTVKAVKENKSPKSCG